MRIKRYMHEHGLSSSTLAKLARKALANGAEKRERLAAQPAHRGAGPGGASGLRQVYENVQQLRGAAGSRQGPGSPRTAFTHVYGALGISACTVVSR